MLCDAVENYIKSAKGLPFFYEVNDDLYTKTLSELRENGLEIGRVSDFCPQSDRFPDIDEIIDYFRTIDIDCRSNKFVLIGLGEYLALRGHAFAEKELRRLKDTTLGTARVVLLLRCVSSELKAMTAEDSRLIEQQRIHICELSPSALSITQVKYPMSGKVEKGVKNLLHAFEDGALMNCFVETELDFSNSIIPVYTLSSAYTIVKQMTPELVLPEEMGTEEMWTALLKELQSNENLLSNVFNKYAFTLDIDDAVQSNWFGYEFRNWLYFLYLKQNIGAIDNNYLRHVVSITCDFKSLKNNILTSIIQIPRSDNQFSLFYTDRKKLIKNFSESDLASFIHENDIDQMESIYRLTDSTLVEKEAIISWISKYGYIDEVETIYPALSQYLKDYSFDCGDHSIEINQYFKQYRMQKVTNQFQEDFLGQVISNAESLIFTHFETRDNAIQKIKDKQSAFLYWIDALGVEYLAYITELAKNKGLSMHVDIAYVELPTITSMNKKFFEEWPGALKQKEPELDEIKHKDKGGFNYEKCTEPIHLASELKIIEKAVDRAATELAMHNCKSFIIASDHGASRLAVIHPHEVKYETDTKGEHSGRCCKEFPNADIPYAISENGYLSLADYGRFRGSRAANVEVHGGATLEEVLVPIITFTLRNQAIIEIRILNKDSIYADRHNGAIVELYISDVKNVNNVSLVFSGSRYSAICKDRSHYDVILPDAKRAKKSVSADIYDGDDLIGNITFDIRSKTARVNDDFDDFFGEDL